MDSTFTVFQRRDDCQNDVIQWFAAGGKLIAQAISRREASLNVNVATRRTKAEQHAKAVKEHCVTGLLPVCWVHLVLWVLFLMCSDVARATSVCVLSERRINSLASR
uniref:Uncharacterized protein n=1 Tax=Steinernema glaseri TaxID=37863 RepID=A0A1I7YEL8_9BILA